MNFTTTSTVGIDTIIKSIQTDLYNLLIVKWVDDIDAYGRVYRSSNKSGVVPIYYISEKDYKDVYFNDSKSGQFFFITEENSLTNDEYLFTNNVKVVFMVNLNKVIGDGRQDELARLDVLNSLREISYRRYDITGIETGVKNVFQGFNTDKINKADINPLHTFCVNIKLEYDIS